MVNARRWLVVACLFALLSVSVEGESARAPRSGTAPQVTLQGSPFGVFYGLTPNGPATTKYLQGLGVHWTRQTLDWRAVEPRRGDYQWKLVDATVKLVEATEQAGSPINLLVTIRARAPWAAGGGKATSAGATAPPADLDDYYRFVNSVVRRARGRIRYWQIENEVEYDVFWKGSPEQYLELLRTGYRAVKEADPNAQVVLAGIGDLAWLTPMVRDEITAGHGQRALAHYNEWAKGNELAARGPRPTAPQQLLAQVKRYDKMSAFTHRLLQSDAARSYDIVDLHAYHPYTLIPAGVQWLRAVMADQGYSKPVWITETSGPNYPEMWRGEQGGERVQAEELVKRYVLAIGAGVERVFWYALQTPPHQVHGKWSHTGLLRPDGTKRPAFEALGRMVRMLDGARAVRTLNAGEGIQAFEFVRPEGSVYVLWSDRGATLRVPVRTARVEVTDALGGHATQESRGGQLELRLSPMPVFVKGPSTLSRASKATSVVHVTRRRTSRTATASSGCGGSARPARRSLSVSTPTASAG